MALGIAVVSFLGFVATVPVVRVPLPPVWAFIPSYESALALTDLITAALLSANSPDYDRVPCSHWLAVTCFRLSWPCRTR